ncbi:ATP-binding protein [Larkinella sp. GY13]|uniref:ATP-binding protein n=1 Tax=Larkinella sp. GY13 TaxID=3453720 RepID=UPI003EE933F9
MKSIILQLSFLSGFLMQLFSSVLPALAQSRVDSLKRRVTQQPDDTSQVNALVALARTYANSRPDTAYRLAQQAYQLARQLNYLSGQAQGLNMMGSSLGFFGHYPKSIRFLQQAAAISRSIQDWSGLSRSLNNLAIPYQGQKDYDGAIRTLREAYTTYKLAVPAGTIPDTINHYIVINTNLGEIYLNKNQPDSADYYLTHVLPLARQLGHFDQEAHVLFLLGDGHRQRRNTATALKYYQRALAISEKADDLFQKAEIHLRLARLYQQVDQSGASLVSARQALAISQQIQYLPGILPASELLVQLYEGRDNTQALRYYKVAVAARDSLFSQEKVKQMLTLSFEEQQRNQETRAAEEAYENQIRTYGLLATIAMVAAVALLLWRTNRRQQRTNDLLNRQKIELDQQRTKAEQALQELRLTQQQLIQKEKMASLGELTAGIAHEIQNPLNFVTNFSEVSGELIDELKGEASAGRLDDVLAIAGDLTMNLQKIQHHGRRADRIVKGMLEHSRPSSGERQATNLNALADEYLKLAYHGLRAQNKDFTVDLRTSFDPDLGLIEAMPQEIGRVLLNVYNNAFYAVQEKKNSCRDGYLPTVTVSTHQNNGQVQIRVHDNGVGIPESVKDKIFQPFFTTKPTGQGTGLGLFLSYEIITKGHGGTLEVETRTGEGTQMLIRLPMAAV